MFLSIKTKLIASIALILGIVVWFVTFLLNGQYDMVDIFDKVLTDNFPAIQSAENLKHNFVLYDDYVFRYLTTNDRSLLDESKAIKKKVSESMQRMEKMVSGPTEKTLFLDLRKEINVYYIQVENLMEGFKGVEKKKKIMGLVLQADSGAQDRGVPKLEDEHTMALLSAEGRNRLTRIYTMCEKLVDINRARLDEAELNIKNIMKNSQSRGFNYGGVALAGIFLITLMLAFGIVSPLQHLLAGVKKVTEGDLELEIPVESGDEVGRLTTSFNTMTRKLKEEHNNLLTQTITDQLTGLHNFRYFQEFFNNELARVFRYHSMLSIIIIDIDHFKHYNDTNGHQMGNVLLKDIAAIMKESLRREDFIARYGGEEFVLVLPQTGKEGGIKTAERIRLSVEQNEFPLAEKQPNKRLTISLGGTSFPADNDFTKVVVAKQLIELADKALYEAKKKGRNRAEWA
jgi:diguanylate cyclase (GGDEF)-like protein